MTIDKILVLILSLIGISFTYWFFLKKQDQLVEAKDEIDILVDGGYKPSLIAIDVNKTTRLNFLRKDSSSCLEEVVLSDFKIRKYLPLNQKVSIEINPSKTGTFDFACGMNMFHGKLEVR